MKTVEEMKMDREAYEAPQCKTIEMQTEGVLLSGSGGGEGTGADDLEDGGAVGFW
ncbi:hypothetical protein [uncultured Bacteroides sp.]|uniref:hypothetical protein n=1 Tax=uncultured Bacteroides sp. TaxID=162156 RepID=UPI00261CD28F|nr:hypothetical protein [uncultured Bacteroides sp.]